MNPASTLLTHHYRPAAWLRVSGEDALPFLQGQFTNDLGLAGPEQAVYGLWLDLKGKTLADSFILAGPTAGSFWIGSYFSSGEAIRRRLEEFIVADDVTVEDLTAEWAGVSVLGEGAEAWRQAQAPAAGIFFRGRRTAGPNWEWLHPLPAGSAIEGAREATAEEMTRLRIRAGIPAIPQEVGPADLPNEAGLESQAISYTKGCYLGQEIMARLKSRGKLRRRLTRVTGPGAPPAPPAGLWQSGRLAGELRSAAPDENGTGFVGFAMLTLAGLDPALPLGFSSTEVGRVALPPTSP